MIDRFNTVRKPSLASVELPFAAASSREQDVSNTVDLVPATDILEQLARIVESPGFVSSPRLCRFLTYVVDRTIHGDPDSLKEFSIALEVFDRSSDYDPNVDAIVRVQARRLRAKLTAYYEQAVGRHDRVLIALRPGNYIPVFRWLEVHQAGEPSSILSANEAKHACVAVLPFVNMSPEPDQDYFCDGITQEIINSLTQAGELNVVSRTSAFQFKGASVDVRDVGRRLDADLIIEGSVRKAGGQMRITAQAVQAESGYQLWSETFRSDAADVFATQEQIAQSVLHLLRVKMRGAGVLSCATQ